MRRDASNPFRAARGFPSALAALLAAGIPLAALLGSGCEGTSSGVDNPGVGKLTVSFLGAEGSALRVTGDLDVYGKDQNPALDPEPLATVRIRNSAVTNLNGEDFRRMNMASKLGAATKRSAAGGEAAPADTPMAFNLVFRSDARTGSLAFGLVYDPAAKAFSRGDSGLERIGIEPRPLIRYEARLLRMDSIHGDVGRVFIPGTPFQAGLSDSGFAFEALPQGIFDLRLLGGDGRIYAVRESLDTRAARVFTPDSVPLGRIDTTDSLNKPVHFRVGIAGPAEAFTGMVTVLDGAIVGLDTADKRIGVLWRILGGQSPDTLGILLPHSLQTQVRFPEAGVYALELAVTVGATVARDTLYLPVREPPAPPKPKLIAPNAGDTLFTSTLYRIAWEMPVKGLVSIQLSTSGGGEGWQVLADSVASEQGISIHPWTPPASLSGSHACSIRIIHSGPDTLVAGMEGTFAITTRAVLPRDTLR